LSCHQETRDKDTKKKEYKGKILPNIELMVPFSKFKIVQHQQNSGHKQASQQGKGHIDFQ
jgi:hypothetical protein